MAYPDEWARIGKILVCLDSREIGMFRFLLEAHDNLALCTTLQKNPAILKIFYPLDNAGMVINALEDMKRTINLKWSPWPGSKMISPKAFS